MIFTKCSEAVQIAATCEHENFRRVSFRNLIVSIAVNCTRELTVLFLSRKLTRSTRNAFLRSCNYGVILFLIRNATKCNNTVLRIARSEVFLTIEYFNNRICQFTTRASVFFRIGLKSWIAFLTPHVWIVVLAYGREGLLNGLRGCPT